MGIVLKEYSLHVPNGSPLKGIFSTQVAQAAVKRMQMQVEEKDSELRNLQTQVKRLRESAMAQHAEDMAEVESLNELLYAKTTASIGNMRDFITTGVDASGNKVDSGIPLVP